MDQLDSIAMCRGIDSFCIFYHFYREECSKELFSLISLAKFILKIYLIIPLVIVAVKKSGDHLPSDEPLPCLQYKKGKSFTESHNNYFTILFQRYFWFST